MPPTYPARRTRVERAHMRIDQRKTPIHVAEAERARILSTATLLVTAPRLALPPSAAERLCRACGLCCDINRADITAGAIILKSEPQVVVARS